MKVVTFYSYKGGMGRSLAAANMATLLAYHGASVVLADFDLEAPGLHYKFDLGTRWNEGVRQGLLDYLDAKLNGQAMSIGPLLYGVDLPSDHDGSIHVLPAGNCPSAEYARLLASIDWHSIFRGDPEKSKFALRGVPAFLDLVRELESIDLALPHRDSNNADILLIDARTGMTEVGGVATALLPDTVVCFLNNNDENLEGARFVLQIGKVASSNLQGSNAKDTEIIPVLTRVPELGLIEDRNVLDNIKTKLNEPFSGYEEGLSIDEIVSLHSDYELEFKETLRVSSNVSPNESLLLRDYYYLAGLLGVKEYLSGQDEELLSKLVPVRGNVNGDELLMQDRIRRGHRWRWPDQTHESVSTRVKHRYRSRGEGLRHLLAVYHSKENGFVSLYNFNKRVARAIGTRIAPRSEPENIIEKRQVWDHLISLRLHEGRYDFCSEPFFLTATRSILVGLVQIGWIRSFSAALAVAEHEQVSIEGTEQQDIRAFIKRISKGTDMPIRFGVLGETAAASESVTLANEIVRHDVIEMISSEEELYTWLREPHTNEIRVSLADHIVNRSAFSNCHDIAFYEPTEGRYPELRIQFSHPIPVGYPYPIDDHEWRRHIGQAIADTLILTGETKWGNEGTPDTVAYDLSKAGIQPFGLDELVDSLVLDMTLHDAEEFVRKVQKQ